MNIEFVLQSGNKKEKTVCPIFSVKEHFTLMNIDFTVKQTEEKNEYEISFVPKEALSLDNFYIVFDLEQNGLKSSETYYYQSGISTNSFARIVRADNEEPGFSSGRDIFMLKSAGKSLNVAFTTFNRFYTYFMFENKSMKAIYSLEGKTVHSGEKYVLERVIINEGGEALSFFEAYTELLHKRMNINITKPVPSGWSSWSCYANGVTEQKVLENAQILADEFADRGVSLIQIDDGWQMSTSFDIKWTSNPESFPSGIAELQKKLSSMGLSLGLWLSAGLVSEGVDSFKELEPHINKMDNKPSKSFSDVCPLDIGDDFVVEMTKNTFKRCKEEYNSVYFKIDFLINIICRMGDYEKPVFFKNDYSVALYRNFIKAIREAVGDDVFLLACGSPIGESAGVFDSIRVSPDIVWGGAGSPGHPGGWKILTLDAQNLVYRSPYHKKVFINDPDALLVREYGWGDDGLHLSEDEALTWATAVAFSGGHILSNDILAALSETRKKIFRSILPPYGEAARPYDFFEYPLSTHSFIEVSLKSVKTQLHAFYNWEGTEPADKSLLLEKPSILIDCHTGEIIGEKKGSVSLTALNPHCCRAVCTKEITQHSFFLYCDENIYLGAGSVYDSYENGTLSIQAQVQPESKIYVFVPSGSRDNVVLNGEVVQTMRLCKMLESGSVFCI